MTAGKIANWLSEWRHRRKLAREFRNAQISGVYVIDYTDRGITLDMSRPIVPTPILPSEPATPPRSTEGAS